MTAEENLNLLKKCCTNIPLTLIYNHNGNCKFILAGFSVIVCEDTLEEALETFSRSPLIVKKMDEVANGSRRLVTEERTHDIQRHGNAGE
jgi:hypothetical protein